MARIDIECSAGHQHEVDRFARDWPATPACPTCAAATAQIHPAPRVTWTVDPIVVYQAPDGSIRYPGDRNGQSAAMYEKLGYRRQEVQGVGAVRSFEKQMNAHERSSMARAVERREMAREARESQQRSQLRDAMRNNMSEFGKDLAREAVRRNDAKVKRYADDPGFHAEVYSNDRSNRDESRDSSGRRHRD